ncbi:MAG: HEAT repeat domain-containing protein [Gemmataceae bacterium]|nr:HEAT repeat domain-containing protein [Gemmataceae bacterium]
MKGRKWIWIGLMGLACPTGVFAQGPAGIAAAAGAVPAGVPAAVPAEPTTLWSFLGISKKQKEACLQKKCQTPCGQLMNKAAMPLTMFTGGIIPPLCNGLPTPEELADKGAVGAAAAIKAEEAGAKARKAAMRYLGTVDCTRFPDAQDALVKGLRGDTNECVRYEAALALGNGCCCTKATMEALSIAGSCSDRDGMPREYSDRVRAASIAALQRCLSCYVDPNPPKKDKPIEGKAEENKTADDKKAEELKKPQNSGDDGDDEIKDAKTETKSAKAPRPVGMDYYARIHNAPRNQIVEEAKRVVEKYNQTASAQAVLNRQVSVASIINQAMSDNAPVAPTTMVNGVPVPRAEVVSARPQNLWDMMTRESSGTGAVMSTPSVTDTIVKSTAEPPTVVMKGEPLPKFDTIVKSEPLPKLDPVPTISNKPKTESLAITSPDLPTPKTGSALPAPIAIKNLSPAEVFNSLGDGPAPRTRTPAELAGQPRGTGMNVITTGPSVVKETPKAIDRPAIKAEPTLELPKAAAAPIIVPGKTVDVATKPAIPTIDLPKPTETVAKPTVPTITMPKPAEVTKSTAPTLDLPKPVDMTAKAPELPKPVIAAKPVEPAKIPDLPATPAAAPKVVEAAKPVETASPLALRALTVMTDPHPTAVREQIAGSLTAADLKGCPELLPVLVEAARSGSDEATRKYAIRAMVRCQANSAPVMSLLEKLTDDPNSNIRVEAAIGLARLRVIK